MICKGSISDEKSVFIKKVVKETEQTADLIKTGLTSYSEYHSKLRLRSTNLASILRLCSQQETSLLKQSIAAVAEAIEEVQKQEKLLQDRIDATAVPILASYHCIGGTIQKDLKVREYALKKEMETQMDMEKILKKETSDKIKVSQTQLALAGASHQVNKVNLALNESVAKFGTKKVQDIKNCLAEYIHSEMVFHAKALEVFSKAQALVWKTDYSPDIEEMKSWLKQFSKSSNISGVE